MTLALQTTQYQRKYRDDILSLMFYSKYTHTHLDWYKAGQWLDLPGTHVVLAFHQGELVGVLGISEILNRSVWVRMMVVAQGYDPALVLAFLWEECRIMLKREGVVLAAILVINPWVSQFLPALGFGYTEDVITMHRPYAEAPPVPETPVTLRNGYLEDIHSILAVDHAAFDPPWQMSANDIRLSQRQAASCTLAVLNDRTVGYEIATRHHTAGHLARLAVHPDMQGKRVGQLLLNNLLTRLIARGVKSVTVNTQQSNERSQRLYQRYGFTRNGFDLAVWQNTL